MKSDSRVTPRQALPTWHRKSLSRAQKRRFANPRNRLANNRELRNLIPDFRFVELRAQGKTYTEIAREFGRKSLGPIARRFSKIGINGENAYWDLGEAFTSDSAAWLAKQMGVGKGLRRTDLAGLIGISKVQLDGILYPHRSQQCLKPEIGKKWISRRDEILIEMLRAPKSSLKPPKSSLLCTLVQDLRGKYGLLISVFEPIQQILRSNPSWGTADLLREVFEQARLEVYSLSPQKNFVRFGRWSPQLIALIERDLPRLRSESRLKWIACDWLASFWSTTRSIVNEALKSKTGAVPPEKMANLIRHLHVHSGQGLAQPRSKSRKKRGPRPIEERERRGSQIRNKVSAAIPIFQRYLVRRTDGADRSQREVELKRDLSAQSYTDRQMTGLYFDRALYARAAKVAARYFVAGAERLEYSTVAYYCRESTT